MITASAEITADAIQGMPEDDWWQSYLRLDNERARQVVATINAQPKTGFVDVVLQHNTQTTRANPLVVPIAGIDVVRCSQIVLDSSGKPTSATLPLAYPTLEWHPTTKGDGSVYVTATFSSNVYGFVRLRFTGDIK